MRLFGHQSNPNGENVDRLLRRPEVEALTGLSKGAIYRLMRQGHFPVAVKIGPGAVRWRESEIAAYIAGLPRAEGRTS